MDKSYGVEIGFLRLAKGLEKLPERSRSKANEQTHSLILKTLSIHNLLMKARYGSFHQVRGGSNLRPCSIDSNLLMMDSVERNRIRPLNLSLERASFFLEKKDL